MGWLDICGDSLVSCEPGVVSQEFEIESMELEPAERRVFLCTTS